MKRGDLIIDMDELYRALSGLELRDKPDCLLPFVAHARDAVIELIQCGRAPKGVDAAWIVTSSPDQRQVKKLARSVGAEIVTLAIPAEECVRRMRAEGRAAVHIKLMEMRCHEWHREWWGYGG